jgi:adenine deaminase
VRACPKARTAVRRIKREGFDFVKVHGRLSRDEYLATVDEAKRINIPALHDELALFVHAGLSPMEALQTATINPAKFFGKETELGTIEKGKLADLILLDADPLADISNTKKINAVVLNGRLFDRSALGKILIDIEAAANKK